MKKLSHTTWGADRETLLKLYKATVFPILEYGSQIYSLASNSVLKSLDPVHHLGLRLATGAFRSSPTPSVIVESGDLPLEYRLKISTMCRALKLKEGPSPMRKIFSERDMFLNSKINPLLPVCTKRLWRNNDIECNSIYNFNNTVPPWNLKIPQVCTKLSNSNYQKIDNLHLLKQKTIEHMESHSGHFPIYTDGSKSEQGVGFASVSKKFKIASSLPH